MTNKRDRARFALAAVVMMRELNTGAAILAQIKNISVSGCYLETARKMPQDGKVKVVLHTCDICTEICGVVRRRDDTGVGIQFSHGATVEDWDRLQPLIRSLQGSAPTGNISEASKDPFRCDQNPPLPCREEL